MEISKYENAVELHVESRIQKLVEIGKSYLELQQTEQVLASFDAIECLVSTLAIIRSIHMASKSPVYQVIVDQLYFIHGKESMIVNQFTDPRLVLVHFIETIREDNLPLATALDHAMLVEAI